MGFIIQKNSQIIRFMFLGLFVSLMAPFAATDANVGQVDLYQTTLSAPDMKASQRTSLFKEGFGQVLQRISGDEAILQHEKVKAALNTPEKYIDQFGYRGQSLFMHFNIESVNDLIFSLNQPVWGQKRPVVLLWLAVAEDNLTRRMMGAEQNPELQGQLEAFATAQGLPLVIPMMDLTDLSQVNVSDIWGGFPTALKKASERYGADAIIVAKVQKTPDSAWSNHWELVVDDYVKEWGWTAEDFQAGLQSGLDRVTTHLLTRYGLKGKGKAQGSILIGVEQIGNLKDFAKAEAYLNSLEQLSDVQVKKVSRGEVIFEVKANAGVSPDILSQVIGMDDHFESLVGKQQKVESTDLAYKLAN